jgi:hypothetical protein
MGIGRALDSRMRSGLAALSAPGYRNSWCARVDFASLAGGEAGDHAGRAEAVRNVRGRISGKSSTMSTGRSIGRGSGGSG